MNEATGAVCNSQSIESSIDTSRVVSELVSNVVLVSSSVSWDIVSDLLRTLSSEVGFKILEFLYIHGATTKPELHRKLGVTYQCSKKYLSRLQKIGIIEQKGRVQSPYLALRISKQIPIYSWVGVDSECLVQAQKRYAELRRNRKTASTDLKPIITRLDELHLSKGLNRYNSTLEYCVMQLHDIPASQVREAYGVYWQKRLNPEASL